MELGLVGGPISLILKYVLQNCMEVRIDNKTLGNVQDIVCPRRGQGPSCWYSKHPPGPALRVGMGREAAGQGQIGTENLG